MSRLSVSVSLAALLLSGCSSGGGSVTFSTDALDLGKFSTVVFEKTQPIDYWRVTTSGLQSDGQQYWTDNSVRFTGSPGLSCRDRQEALDARADATYELLNATNDGADGEELCAAMPDYYLARQDSPWPDRELRVGYCDWEGATCTGPEVGRVESTGGGSYTIRDSSEDPWQVLADSWNEADCAPGLAAYRDTTRYEVGDADIRIDEVIEGKRVRGSFSATVYREGGEVGSVDAEFDAELCELTMDAPWLNY